MKKLIIATIAIVGFSVASYAQVSPTAKKDDTKTQVVKKAHNKKEATKDESTKNLAMHHPKKDAATNKRVKESKKHS